MAGVMTTRSDQPGRDCPLCPRLVEYRLANRAKWPDWHNAPVPCWGPQDARIMVLGLAPGVKGANRTGRPFTGDHAGKLLYATLLKYGLAQGEYREDPRDGMELTGVRIVNAVRCVPPENLPTPPRPRPATASSSPSAERCRGCGPCSPSASSRTTPFCSSSPHPRRALQVRPRRLLELPGGLLLADSYHVSRYNTQTGRLTTGDVRELEAETQRAASADPPARGRPSQRRLDRATGQANRRSAAVGKARTLRPSRATRNLWKFQRGGPPARAREPGEEPDARTAPATAVSRRRAGR
jgi:uracil-DNA glycosylase